MTAVVAWVEGAIRAGLGSTGYNISAGIVGVGFLALAAWQGWWKFAKHDEKATAWRNLLAFGLFLLLAIKFTPVIRDYVGWLASHVTIPIGGFVAGFLDYIFR